MRKSHVGFIELKDGVFTSQTFILRGQKKTLVEKLVIRKLRNHIVVFKRKKYTPLKIFKQLDSLYEKSKHKNENWLNNIDWDKEVPLSKYTKHLNVKIIYSHGHKVSG